MTAFLTALPGATAMWWAMMLVMMAPVTVPWVGAVGRLTPTGAAPRERAMAAPLFAFGYAAVWLGFAIAAGAAQVAFDALGWLGSDHALPGPLAGAVLIGAGLYQVTPAKAACLRHCRNPLTYFLTKWRNGPRGAFGMGAAHGLYCLGCCWALMGAAFALGVMSFAWMAVLAAIVLVENLVSWGPRVGRMAGWAAVAWGAWMVVGGI